jgi:tRNA C32,U32 (ribose-2'-O)-methylase TrmJ
MTISLPLQPHEEAQLLAAAKARGVPANVLVRDALYRILAETSQAETLTTESKKETLPPKEPTRSARGLLAKYGPAPSAKEIDRNRVEMFANFARDDS